MDELEAFFDKFSDTPHSVNAIIAYAYHCEAAKETVEALFREYDEPLERMNSHCGWLRVNLSKLALEGKIDIMAVVAEAKSHFM